MSSIVGPSAPSTRWRQTWGKRAGRRSVTHGGFIQEVLQRYLAGRGQRVHAFAGNTSLTRLIWSFDRLRLAGFNDLAHFGPRPTAVSEHLEKGDPVLALVRHGQTRANTEGRWQGQGDWGLDELGHRQAKALRDWYGTAADRLRLAVGPRPLHRRVSGV